jgi:hypothetical protein
LNGTIRPLNIMNNLCVYNLLQIAEFCGETAFYMVMKPIYKYRIVRVNRMYLYNLKWQKTLLQSIHNKLQIRICLEVYNSDIKVTNMRDLIGLSNVELIFCNIVPCIFDKISYYLKNIHTLTINFSSKFLYDVSCLENVHNLTLMNGYIQNVALLKNVHTLNLHNISHARY